MKWVPFTVHIKITPSNHGKKFEYWRDMQKLGTLVYEGISTIAPSIINIAMPGGGQQVSRGRFSWLSKSCAVKPQFGQTPSQLQITGFYNSNSQNLQPHPVLKRIHAGEVLTGPGAHSWDSNPTSNINSEVKSLKTVLENAVPVGIQCEIFRIDYSGIIYGDRGYYFPR